MSEVMEWSNENVIAFLGILQTEPCLWDPRLKSFKNRASQNDAWRRIMPLLPFKATVEEMKKKKESLMGYYRTLLHKYKKSLKSGASNNEVHTSNWFAYETMDSFLREVYINDCSDTQERSKGKNDGNENSPYLALALEKDRIEEASQNNQEVTHLRENISSQNCGRKRHLKDDLPPEIKAARRQMDESFELIQQKKDDEYEIFGKLIAIKLKKIINPNTRDILMNEIHNLVIQTCMADRLEQRSAVPQFSTYLSPHHQFSPSLHPSEYQSSPGPSTSMSPHHKVFSPSPNASPYQSPPGRSTSLSPYHQVLSPSQNPSTYQSPPGSSTSMSPHH